MDSTLLHKITINLQVGTLRGLHVTAALAGVVTLNVHGGARHLAHAVRVRLAQKDLKLLGCKKVISRRCLQDTVLSFAKKSYFKTVS